MSQRRSKGGGDAGQSSQAGPSSQKGKGGKKEKASEEEEQQGSDDEFMAPASQVGGASQGAQGIREWNAMSSEDKRRCVNKIINFMLARDADKVPAKRADISELLKRGTNGKALPAGVVTRLIEETKEKFEKVFGFELVEQNTDAISDVVLTQASQSQSRAASSKVYMLINALRPPPAEQGQQPPAEAMEEEEEEPGFKRKRAEMFELGAPSNPSPRFDLAMVLMGVVALHRYKIEEPVLWDKLRALGLAKGTENPVFGLPEKALAELCSQGYLHQKKSKDADNQVKVHYCLGLRAESEVGRREILAFVEYTFGEKMTAATKKALLDADGSDDEDEEPEAAAA